MLAAASRKVSMTHSPRSRGFARGKCIMLTRGHVTSISVQRSGSKKEASLSAILRRTGENCRGTRQFLATKAASCCRSRDCRAFSIRQHTCRSIRSPALCCPTTARWPPGTARPMRGLPQLPIKHRKRPLSGKLLLHPAQTAVRSKQPKAAWKEPCARLVSPPESRRAWSRTLPVAMPRRSAFIGASASTVMTGLLNRV